MLHALNEIYAEGVSRLTLMVEARKPPDMAPTGRMWRHHCDHMKGNQQRKSANKR